MRKFTLIILLAALNCSVWADDIEDRNANERATKFVAAMDAAYKGDANAEFDVAVMYEYGRGTPVNFKKAVKWYQQAVDHGIADAQFNLGQMYQNGKGIPPDYKEAVHLYRLAAVQGHDQAQSILGGLYFFGEGVAKDLVKALMWGNLAAASGNSNAVKLIDLATKAMTPQQISDAKKMAQECLAKNYKDCD